MSDNKKENNNNETCVHFLKHPIKWVSNFLIAQKNFILLLIVLFLVPIAINQLFLDWSIPTAEGLNNGTWLSFWSGYLGAFIGCIPAYLALEQSKKQAKQQHEQFQEELQESRQQTKQHYEEAERNRRLSVQPIFHIDLNTMRSSPSDVSHICERFSFDLSSGFESLSRTKYAIDNDSLYYSNRQKYLEFRNLGFGPALEIRLVYSPKPHTYSGNFLDLKIIDKGEAAVCIILYKKPLPEVHEQEEVATFILFYDDVFGNQYQQTFRLLFSSDGYFITAIKKPELLSEYPVE